MMKPVTRQQASEAVAQLMPNVIRGVQLDFFLKRRITQTQLLMLLAIRAYDQPCMGRLAGSLHVSMPTATGIAGRLSRAGYVRRLPCETDRRKVFVQLTSKGEQFIRDFQAVIRRRWERVLESLDPSEITSFYHVITKLRARLQARFE